MGLITTGLIIGGLSTFGYSLYKKHFINSFINKVYINRSDNNAFLDLCSSFEVKEHTLEAFDGTKLYSYISKTHNCNNYIIYIHGYSFKTNDMSNIAKGFEELGYNSIFIKNRDFCTYGIKESFDIIEWISYFVNLNKDINLTILAEKDGASYLIKALNSKLPHNVKSVIIDDLKEDYLFDLINEYCVENDIKNHKKFLKELDLELKNRLNLSILETNIDKSLKNNTIPIVFVYSHVRPNLNYKNVLKIYNQNLGIKKFFYTNCLDRNYLQKNYFMTLDGFIKNYL